MREIVPFVEDYAHRQVVGALVRRLAEDYDLHVVRNIHRRSWSNACISRGKQPIAWLTHLPEKPHDCEYPVPAPPACDSRHFLRSRC